MILFDVGRGVVNAGVYRESKSAATLFDDILSSVKGKKLELNKVLNGSVNLVNKISNIYKNYETD